MKLKQRFFYTVYYTPRRARDATKKGTVCEERDLITEKI
jgi:hypothetical protein